MELSKETMKRIGTLILFAAAVLTAVIHIDAVVQFIAFVLGVLSPFLIGSAIAFVLNLPMKFIETKLLGDNRIKSRKMRAARRPISLILTLLLVIGLFSLVILVVVPELVNTFTLMVENINEFIPTMKEWILVIFKDNTVVQKWLNAHPLDVNTLLQKLVEFLQSSPVIFWHRRNARRSRCAAWDRRYSPSASISARRRSVPYSIRTSPALSPDSAWTRRSWV